MRKHECPYQVISIDFSEDGDYNIAPVCGETYNTVVLAEDFQISTSNLGSVEAIKDGWRLSIPSGDAGSYRLAQIDNYSGLKRSAFAGKAPLRLDLLARASSAESPGTWGFGLWNDPFALSFGFGGRQQLPALPNAAWFFFASAENHLSFRDGVPGSGALAATFRSEAWQIGLVALASPLAPFMLWRKSAKLLRSWSSKMIKQDAIALSHKVVDWQQYSIVWEEEHVKFLIDEQIVFTSSVSPYAPLGLVIWTDNQAAAWRPDGSFSYSTLASDEPHWLEVKDVQLS
jgi:hypothetical protein